MKKITFLIIITILVSCKPTQQIVNTKTTEYVDRLKYDSIFVSKHDSIYIHQRGDTVFVERFTLEFKDIIKIQKDIVFKNVDKYSRIIKTVEVEKKLTWIQSILIWIGKLGLIVIIICLIYFAIKYFNVWSKIFTKLF